MAFLHKNKLWGIGIQIIYKPSKITRNVETFIHCGYIYIFEKNFSFIKFQFFMTLLYRICILWLNY